MVGSNGNSTTEVFQSIMETEGWKGLFRGNFVNVIRVAPSKAIEVIECYKFTTYSFSVYSCFQVLDIILFLGSLFLFFFHESL